jgi:hypothetical protein
VDIAFDAPAKEWSGKLTTPTVDPVRPDLREASERTDMIPRERRRSGQQIVTAPSLRLTPGRSDRSSR